MVLIDAVVRQLPGALGMGCRRAGLVRERAPGLPAVHAAGNGRGEALPPVLLSGHHALIERWRLKQSLGAAPGCGGPSCSSDGD